MSMKETLEYLYGTALELDAHGKLLKPLISCLESLRVMAKEDKSSTSACCMGKEERDV